MRELVGNTSQERLPRRFPAAEGVEPDHASIQIDLRADEAMAPGGAHVIRDVAVFVALRPSVCYFPRLHHLDGLPPFDWRLGQAGAAAEQVLGV